MSEAKRIRKNSVYSLLSISFRLISNVLVFWLIARYYGPSVFGQFTLAHTISTMSILLGDFGFDILLTTGIAREREKAAEHFQIYSSVKFLFSITAMILMWLLASFGNFSIDARLLILIFSFYMMFTTLTNFLYAFFKGFEELQYETKVTLFVNIGLLIIIAILIMLKSGIILISVGFVVFRILGFIIAISFSFKIMPGIRYKFNITRFHEIKTKMIVFGLHLLFSNLYFQLDTILLGLWKGDYYVGIYQSVFKLIMLPLVLPDIFNNTLIPALSRLNKENVFLWKKIGYIMNKILILVVIPISMILFLYADQIIKIIYGTKNYIEAIPLLRIFAAILFVRFFLETYALMLTTSNRQHIRMYVVISATFFNFLLNYFAIPKFGVIGAAIVSLITNSLLAIAYIGFTYPLFIDWVINIKTFALFLFSLILVFAFWQLHSLNVLIMAPVILVIFILCGILVYFTKDEKRQIIGKEFSFNSLN